MIQFDEANHTYAVGGVRLVSVTQVIADAGLYGNAANFFTEYTRDRGLNIHKIIQWHLSKELDETTVGPAERPYFDAWLKFEAEADYVSDACEKVMASVPYGVAGTVDHVGHLNGHPCLIDTKTGFLMPATAIQLAGYEILIKSPGIKRFGLQLMDTGKYKLTEFKSRSDRGFSCRHYLFTFGKETI